MKNCLKIENDYYLISESINNDVTVNVKKKVNHIFVVDVSGSMYYDLPLIRTQLKNKLSNVMREGDTISIVWFSGRNDAGILKEVVEVRSLKTLTDLNNAIDKWLHPIGMTAFLKPLELVRELVSRVKINRPDSVFSLMFLTDGYNNDCPFNDVLKVLKSLENDIVSSCFVEYGHYADSKKITDMAGILGGEKISCNGFDEFEPIFNNKISSKIMGGKKIVVDVDKNHLYDFAFSLTDDGVMLYNIQDYKIMVNEDVKNLYYFSNKNIGTDVIKFDETPIYGAIYLLADKFLNDDAEKLLAFLGDQHYYKNLINAYGKQKLNSFKTSIKECIIDQSKRYLDGKTKINKIDDNAYCFMNLIEDLGKINAHFYPSHPDFQYNRIGRKKISAASTFTDEEKKRLSEAKNVEEASAILKEFEEKKVDIKFVNAFPDKSYPMTDVVWNEERANLSIRIRIDGEVILPENKFGIDKVASFKYNTFTLVKDGIINIERLPVNYTKELEDYLTKNNVGFGISSFKSMVEPENEFLNSKYFVIDLMSIPIINKNMVKSISAKSLAELEWNLIKLQAEKKVYDYYKKSLFPKTSKSFSEMLGQECADWLKEIGITDYNGFAPKTVFAESTDFYISLNLATKIKGLSSLPKVEDVILKINSNKDLKLNEIIMADAIKNYQSQINSDMYKTLNETEQKNLLEKYLIIKTNELNNNRRELLQKIAQIKFSLILSRRWFNEFKNYEENKLSLNIEGQELQFTFDLSEKEEKI